MKRKINSYQKGVRAEFWAAMILRLKGYKILARRYKTPVGEIDLIACKKDVVAFVEVKERACIDTALSAVTPQMRRRITRAARYFLADQCRYADNKYTLRFDLMALSGFSSWKHLDNAWQADS